MAITCTSCTIAKRLICVDGVLRNRRYWSLEQKRIDREMGVKRVLGRIVEIRGELVCWGSVVGLKTSCRGREDRDSRGWRDMIVGQGG